MDRITAPRIASLWLFLGGGAFLWLFYVCDSDLEVVLFPLGWATILGYVIWAFWFFRVIFSMSIRIRKSFWILSSVWHAVCLIFSIPFISFLIALPHWGLRLVIPWAMISLVTSIIMIRIDTYAGNDPPRH